MLELELSKMNTIHAGLIIDWMFELYFYDNKVCEANMKELLRVIFKSDKLSNLSKKP